MTCQEDCGFPGDYQFSVVEVGSGSKSYLDKSKPFFLKVLNMLVDLDLCLEGRIYTM